MFVYLTAPSPAALVARERARLKEAESTVAKRLAWAKAQCARAAGEARAAFDHVVANVDDREQARRALKGDNPPWERGIYAPKSRAHGACGLHSRA